MTSTPGASPLPQQVFAVNAITQHPLSRDLREDRYPVVPVPIRALLLAEYHLRAKADQERSATREAYPELVTRLEGDLLAGKALPDDFTDQALSAVGAVERIRVAELVLSSLQGQLEARWRESLREHVDEMLTGLAQQLDPILDEVRSAAAVIDGLDLTDVEAVNEATPKQRKALADLKALRPRYRRLRGLQERLLDNLHTRPPAGSGVTSWQALFKAHEHEFSNVAGYGQPAEDLPSVLWFRRLLNRDDVWLPTLTELTEVMAKHLDPEPERRRHGWTEQRPGTRPLSDTVA